MGSEMCIRDRFKRVFYKPEPVRPLEEIDADVSVVMGRLAEKFAGVRE